jgi:hydrogenase nickel incorporation protein HypB
MANLITIEQKILKKNADLALENRREIERRGLYALGLVSAPGSGKTSLLERTLGALEGRVRSAVIEGDVQTDRDAQRIAALDVPVVQIVTNGTCHLEARMVQEALPRLPPRDVDLLFIENVGNLVCPSSYDLGEHARAVLLSVTEGEDKPIKYPSMFRAADVLVITKVDLLPHLDYDIEAARRFARQVNPGVRIFEVSSRDGSGMDAWTAFLVEQVADRRRSVD